MGSGLSPQPLIGTCSRSRPMARCRFCSGTPAWSPNWPRCAIGARLHIKRLFGTFALGWRGSARHWGRYETPNCCSRACRRRWSSRCTRSSASTSRWASYRLALTIFPPYFRRRRRLCRLRDGADELPSAAQVVRDGRTSSRCANREHGEGHAGDRYSCSTVLIEVFFAWYSANEYEKYMIITGPPGVRLGILGLIFSTA